MYQIVPVRFCGDDLFCVRRDDGVWVSTRRVCDALGMDHASQHRRLADPDNAHWATVVGMTTVAEDGKQRELTMIHIDALPTWLSHVKPSRVAKEVREKLIRYQVECKNALAAHFFGQPQQTVRQAVYVNRLQLAFHSKMGVERGYWTVFDAASKLMILIECELKFPVERFDLLDGSVGSHWSKFREGKEWAKERRSYLHGFPDRRGERPAAAYHLDELPHFERWLADVYIPKHLPPYLDRKYQPETPAIQMLAAVPSLRMLAAGVSDD